MKFPRIPEAVREFFTFGALLWGVASAGFLTYLVLLSWDTGFITLNFGAARAMFIEMYILIPLVLIIAVVGLGLTLWKYMSTLEVEA